jgi:hypothetical protein
MFARKKTLANQNIKSYFILVTQVTILPELLEANSGKIFSLNTVHQVL